ncbi:hypothetical protein Pfo_017061, partial [Paulownia fortunei]
KRYTNPPIEIKLYAIIYNSFNIYISHLSLISHFWNFKLNYLNFVEIDCGVACAARCRLASRQNLCKRACGTCCARCNCVPPGTSGNQELCPCYYTMTTQGGRRKCP